MYVNEEWRGEQLRVQRTGNALSVVVSDSFALGTRTISHRFEFSDSSFSKVRAYSGTSVQMPSEQWKAAGARKAVIIEYVPLKGAFVSHQLPCGLLLQGLPAAPEQETKK